MRRKTRQIRPWKSGYDRPDVTTWVREPLPTVKEKHEKALLAEDALSRQLRNQSAEQSLELQRKIINFLIGGYLVLIPTTIVAIFLYGFGILRFPTKVINTLIYAVIIEFAGMFVAAIGAFFGKATKKNLFASLFELAIDKILESKDDEEETPPPREVI